MFPTKSDKACPWPAPVCITYQVCKTDLKDFFFMMHYLFIIRYFENLT